MSRPVWVYRVYDDVGRLIYVGQTTYPDVRFTIHRCQSWWHSQIADVRWEEHCCRASAVRAESAAIATELPRWNRRVKWNARERWSHQDWLDYFESGSHSPDTPKRRAHDAAARAEYAALYPAEAASR